MSLYNRSYNDIDIFFDPKNQFGNEITQALVHVDQGEKVYCLEEEEEAFDEAPKLFLKSNSTRKKPIFNLMYYRI